jgi:hypothetical protein
MALFLAVRDVAAPVHVLVARLIQINATARNPAKKAGRGAGRKTSDDFHRGR